MSLYQKYRPTSLDDVVGNEETIESLRADLTKDDPPCAILLVGPTGCGKTTLGRIAGQMLGADGSDYVEINSADFRGIDTVRDIRRQAHYSPMAGGKSRVWLIDECHKGTGDFQAAFLKLLEDPPSHTHFILATTDPQKLLPTIKSRCSTYSVRTLKEDEMFRLLRRVVKGEGKTLTKEAYEEITESSEGLPRNALQILDSVLAVDPEKRLEVAKRGVEKKETVLELCKCLLHKAGWKKVAVILASIQESGEEEPERVRRAILGYMNSVLLKGEENDQAAIVLEAFEQNVFDAGWPAITFNCYQSIK